MSSGDTSHMLPEAEGGPSGRRSFGTKIGFVMAAAGSAVGLGNLIRFPALAGEHGGGAFVLIYLLAVLLIGLPLMYSELAIGRRGRSGIYGAIDRVAGRVGFPSRLLAAGGAIMAVGACFLMLSFYSVVAGWGLHYLFGSLGVVPGFSLSDPTAFDQLKASPGYQILWHTVFMLLTVLVVSRGVRGGIERVCNWMMPLLILFLLGLVAYVGYEGGLRQAGAYLFEPDFSKVSPKTVLDALGQAFFSLSLGMGTMIIYGSYMQSDRHIVRDGVSVAVMDTGVALLGGMVVFGVIFWAGGAGGSGYGLLFRTLPNLFASMPGGQVISVAFFILVLFAAWSSSISLLEVATAYFMDEHGWGRRLAAWLLAGVIWYLGVEAVLSGGVFDWRDDLTSKILFPLGGLLVAIVAGWLMIPEDRFAGFEMNSAGGRAMAYGWLFLIRFVTPVLVVLVMLSGFGVLDLVGTWLQDNFGSFGGSPTPE